MSVFVKAAIWIFVSALYVAQTSPVFFRQYNAASDAVLPWIGAAVSACAILLEALADRQKSEQKKQNPNMRKTGCPITSSAVFRSSFFSCKPIPP